MALCEENRICGRQAVVLLLRSKGREIVESGMLDVKCGGFATGSA